MENVSGMVPNATIEEMNREMLQSMIPVLVVISAIAVLGITGNMFVIAIYPTRYPKCNFKYFVLILAGIDMVSCSVLMPLEVVTFTHWFIFPSAGLCKFKSALNVYTVTASASCLLLIAIDRFRKVCKPHSQQISPALALKLTAVVLTLSSIPAASDAVFWGLHTYTLRYKGTIVTAKLCEKDDLHKDTIWPKLHTTVLYAGSNVAVMTATLILYIFIAKTLFCQPGPVLAPEITISSPDTETTGEVSPFSFAGKGISCQSDIESGLTESDISNRSSGSLSADVILEEQTNSHNSGTKADTVRFREPSDIESSKKNERIASEISEIEAETSLTFLTIPDAAMRPKTGVPGPKSPCSPSNERYRRRRSTLHSLKGQTGVRLRRKTLIMFILTFIFIVTTSVYLAMISHMADSNHYIQELTVTERIVWLFFLRLYFVNSFINPLLYGFLDTRFRRKLWDMGIRVRWLAGSLKRNIEGSTRRSDSGRAKTDIAERPARKDVKHRPRSSATQSD